MRKIFVSIPVLFALATWSVAAPANQATAQQSSSATPSPTPKPKLKPKVTATPAATVSPTPAVKTTARAKATASPAESPATAVSATPKPRGRVQSSPTVSPSPSATPTPKKASLFHRIFVGSTPTPAPARTPAAKVLKVRNPVPPGAATPGSSPAKAEVKPLPAMKATYKPTPAPVVAAASATPAPASRPTPPSKRVKPTPTPASDDNGDKPTVMTGDVPFVPTPAPENRNTVKPAIASGDDETKEKARYREIKAVALEDKEIKALKEKADAATSDDDMKATSKAYYKTLFKKMRALDPSLSDHIDRMEKATMRKLDGGGVPQ